MRKLSNRLSQQFKRTDGVRFKGIITSAVDGTDGPNASFRILRVRNPCYVNVGDVVQTFGLENVILMEHPEDSEHTTNFKAASAVGVGPWLRMAKILDPVTKVWKDGPWLSMGALYLNFDTPKEIPLAALTDTRYRFITGQDVKPGDKIGVKVVKTVYDILGVKLGFAE